MTEDREHIGRPRKEWSDIAGNTHKLARVLQWNNTDINKLQDAVKDMQARLMNLESHGTVEISPIPRSTQITYVNRGEWAKHAKAVLQSIREARESAKLYATVGDLLPEIDTLLDITEQGG